VARGIASPWEKADAVGAVAPLLALVRDPVERADFVRRLALAIGLDERHVEASVRAVARGGEADVALDAAAHAHAAALSGPEARALGTLAQILLAHPETAAEVERGGLVASLPAGAWRTLLEALVASAASGGAEAGALADTLDGEARGLLLALAASDDADLDADGAARALREIATWFERRRIAEETRRLRADLRRDEGAAGETLAALQRQLERKKAALGLSSAPSSGR
jgi:hypothetical protein